MSKVVFSGLLLNRTWNPSEPYSDKEIPLRRALMRLLCWLGSQMGIHCADMLPESRGERVFVSWFVEFAEDFL